MKKEPIKSHYRFKKQWDSIISSMMVPENVPLSFAKKIEIMSSDSKSVTVYSKAELEKHIQLCADNQESIQNIRIELNYQKLIDKVEKQIEKILKNI